MEQSKFNVKQNAVILQNAFFHRRDFRFAKVDPTTGKIVPNPVVWLEMKNIETVRRVFRIYLCVFFHLGAHWSINNLHLCHIYTTRWALGWFFYASGISWTRK